MLHVITTLLGQANNSNMNRKPSYKHDFTRISCCLCRQHAHGCMHHRKHSCCRRSAAHSLPVESCLLETWQDVPCLQFSSRGASRGGCGCSMSCYFTDVLQVCRSKELLSHGSSTRHNSKPIIAGRVLWQIPFWARYICTDPY